MTYHTIRQDMDNNYTPKVNVYKICCSWGMFIRTNKLYHKLKIAMIKFV